MKLHRYLMLGVAMVVAGGCATAKNYGTSDTSAEPAKGAKPATAAKKPVVKKAVVSATGGLKVEKGMTLWGLAKSAQTYNKSCQWPVLYKANKDKIQDPDLIYPGQVLTVPKEVASADSSKACSAAAKYGKSTPHKKPRTDVQLDY